jgi:dipeptidyl aminopeptidase/acylaminoacyl peptidase
MTDLTPFEQRLGQRLARELDRGDLPFDAERIATTAMVRRRPLDRMLNRLALGPMPMATARKTALVAVAALLALVTLALAVGVVRPGGARLAFIRWNGDVVVARGDGSEQAVIYRVASGPLLFTALVWAPGGEYLAVVDETLQFAIIGRTGDVIYMRTFEPGRGRFAWSPDGKRLAIFNGPWAQPEEQIPEGGAMSLPRLDIVGLDGGVETVPLPPGFWFHVGRGDVAWSPDGRSIVVTGTVDRTPQADPPSSLWIVDTADRTVRELPSGDPSRAVHLDYLPAWLPDGRLVYSSVQSGIRLIDPRTNESTTIHEIDVRECGGPCAPYVSVLEVSPDGTRIAFFDPAKGYSIHDLATGTSAEVPFPQDGGFPHPLFGAESTAQWTADGRGLVGVFYSGTAEAREVSVATIDIATGEVQELGAEAQIFDYVP